MQLLILTTVAMFAFAANSVLTRQGVALFDTDPLLFAVIRVLAGAAMLWMLLWRRGAGWPAGSARRRWSGGASLALYMAGFSLAYLSFDAGGGALILFGGVQITMFAGAVIGREEMPPARVLGAVIALCGLAVLVWPAGDVVLPVMGVVMMLAAAVAWGIYSLLGRGEPDPMAATAASFAICLPMVLPLLIWSEWRFSLAGVGLAMVAGAVTSGLGYALWYRVVPVLGASRAAVAQLSVPVIAALGGMVVLNETVSLRLVLACALVLGGISVSLVRRS